MTPRQQNEQVVEAIPKICPSVADSVASDQLAIMEAAEVMQTETLVLQHEHHPILSPRDRRLSFSALNIMPFLP